MRKYFKLLGKCILVLAPVWICAIYSFAELPRFISPDSVGIYWNTKITKNKQERKYNVVILGDSTANSSYIPELLSDSTINLALAGTSVVENYYTLENYLENNEAPKDVFISIADYHLAQDNFTWPECNMLHKLSLRQNLEIYLNIKKYCVEPIDEVIRMDSYWPDALLYKTYMPSKYIYSLIQGFDSNRGTENEKSLDAISKRLGRYANISNDIFESDGEVGFQEYKVNAFQDEYYRKLIRLCADNNIKLHILKLPAPQNVYYFDSYVEEINDYYSNLISGYSNVDFLWPTQLYETFYFADGTHLNNHGAKMFSKVVNDLYPKAFGDDDYPIYRIEAIDEDIKSEAYYDHLEDWIEGLDYEVQMVESEGQTYINIKNNYTGELVSKKRLFLNDSGVYEMEEE